jgi:4-amino-4-deoxy-L-arabinose transferase-like glycosyltransferase
MMPPMDPLPTAPARPSTVLGRRDRHLILALAIAFLLAQVPRWWRPIGNSHIWRQADTAAVARNLVLESFDPLHPRVDVRGDTSGITGMEFPLYQMTVATFLRLAGTDVDWPGKLVSAGAALAACLLLGSILHRRLGLRPAAAWPAAFASAMVFVYAGKVMPETTALALALLGWWAYERFRAGESPALAAALCITSAALALLVRPFVAFIFLPILVDCLAAAAHRRWRVTIGTALLGLAILAPGAWWYGWWVPHLRQRFGIDYFFMGHPLADNLAVIATADPWRRLAVVVAQDFCRWFLLPLVLLGWWALLRAGGSRPETARVRLVAWTLPVIVIAGTLLSSGRHFDPHVYYLVALVPVIAVAAGIGLEELSRWRPRLGRAVALSLPFLLVGLHPREYCATKAWRAYATVLPRVAAEVPAEDLVVVENTGHFSFHLHPLRRRGWVVDAHTLRDPARIASLRDRGARWVLPRDPTTGDYALHPIDAWLAVAGPAGH